MIEIGSNNLESEKILYMHMENGWITASFYVNRHIFCWNILIIFKTHDERFHPILQFSLKISLVSATFCPLFFFQSIQSRRNFANGICDKFRSFVPNSGLGSGLIGGVTTTGPDDRRFDGVATKEVLWLQSLRIQILHNGPVV